MDLIVCTRLKPSNAFYALLPLSEKAYDGPEDQEITEDFYNN
jgi:hypothetical protein